MVVEGSSAAEAIALAALSNSIPQKKKYVGGGGADGSPKILREWNNK